MEVFHLIDMDTGRIVDTSDLGNIAEHHMVLCEAGRNVRMFNRDEVKKIATNDSDLTVFPGEGGQLEALVIHTVEGEVSLNEIIDIKDARNMWKGFFREGGVMVQ